MGADSEGNWFALLPGTQALSYQLQRSASEILARTQTTLLSVWPTAQVYIDVHDTLKALMGRLLEQTPQVVLVVLGSQVWVAVARVCRRLQVCGHQEQGHIDLACSYLAFWQSRSAGDFSASMACAHFVGMPTACTCSSTLPSPCLLLCQHGSLLLSPPAQLKATDLHSGRREQLQPLSSLLEDATSSLSLPYVLHKVWTTGSLTGSLSNCIVKDCVMKGCVWEVLLACCTHDKKRPKQHAWGGAPMTCGRLVFFGHRV